MSELSAQDGSEGYGACIDDVARWSSGQDGGLSRRKREFDSPTGHHPRKNFILILAAKAVKIYKSVLIAMRVHPFPSRTRQLSSFAPKILGW